jgi:electron transport complex protein RnfD
MQLVKKFSTSQIMRQVIYATLPIILISITLFGFITLWQIATAILTAIIIDVIAAKLKHKPLFYFTSDYSSILTALLLALSIPIMADFWVIIVGVSFALIFAKYLYGGMGNNIFNPAMVGYVFLIVSYPASMTIWQIRADLSISYFWYLNDFDVLSGATLLDSAKHNLENLPTQSNTIYLSIAAIFGGIYLLIRKIISWHIPVFLIVGFSLTLFVINIFGTNLENNHDIIFHIFAGGLMFGAFFIATDPVSTCSTIKGRIIFAILVGFLIAIIRIFGNYPDGIAFAILIANMSVPLIDYYIKK